jgi:CRISPR-associated protein Csb1
LSLAALRLLDVDIDITRTLALRHYILGLALVAFTYRQSSYLRQGCNLVLDPDRRRECVEVHGDGRRNPIDLENDEVFDYAVQAAEAFGVGRSRTVEFDQALAKQDVQRDKAAAGETPSKKQKKK